jgi:Xaa-Pro aminopeptidase
MSEVGARRPPSIPAAEYEQRVASALDGAKQRGLDGLLVWGRGGGTLDRHSDLVYLTGHYPAFPAIPDLTAHWRGRGHAAALLTSAEGVDLVVDEPEPLSPAVSEDQVHHGHDVIACLVQTLRQRGLGRARLGLIGGGALSVAHSRILSDELPALELVAGDDVTASLRMIKSPAEQAIMRHTSRVGVELVDAMRSAAVPGATEADLACAAVGQLARAGGTLANLFIETNGPGRAWGERRQPTFDSRTPLAAGDLVLVDVTGVIAGYYFDLSRSWVVDREPTGAQSELMVLTEEVIDAVVGGLRPGRTVTEAIQPGLERLRAAGRGGDAVEFGALGHGLGLGFEPPWLVAGDERELAAGMVIAVEKAVWLDEWAASYEDVALITGDAPEILTGEPGGSAAS